MSELRFDPITGRWNIINTDDPMGPDRFKKEQHVLKGGTCPFCYGNEGMTPKELFAIRPDGSKPNTDGWKVRVVPNKFPALKMEGDLIRRGLGVFDFCSGVGAHEIIVESPDHERQTADLTLEELNAVVTTFKLRSLQLREDRRLRYTLIFKNFGLSAGASLEHSHTQIISLPIVPKRITEKLRGAQRYFEFRERCVFCDMLYQEALDKERTVCENRSFTAICPYVSSFPFEIWILPKVHVSDFSQISPLEIGEFARILKETLGRLRTALGDPSYNFTIHTSPFEPSQMEEFHWHVEIMPKLTRVAGFEWGTGFYINPTPPELAAQILQEVPLG